MSEKMEYYLIILINRNDIKNNTVSYSDEETKELMTVSVLGGSCKLQWKCDWAMRWLALGVDYEMAGKDLSESVILSSKILRVLGAIPPSGFSYELFLDNNGEKISKSKGNGLSIEEWLKYGSSESLGLFMFTNPKRAKRLYFDVIPKNVDEYFRFLDSNKNKNIEETIKTPLWYIHNGKIPNSDFQISYGIILNLASVCNATNPDVLWGFLKKYLKEDNNIDKSYLNILVTKA